MKKIVNAKIITPYRVLESGYEIAYERTKIIKVDKHIPNCDEVIDAKGLFVVPGFIDLHIHGGGGYTFIEENEEKMKEAIYQSSLHGITALTPSHMVPVVGLGKIISKLMDLEDGPEILGFHAETIDWPYAYGEPKNMGKEIPDYTNEMCDEILKQVPCLKRIGIDPCFPNAAKITKYLKDRGLNVSICHCGPATYNQVMKCVEAGANVATHLYTGMYGFYRDKDSGERMPGLIEDCLLEPELMAEVIGNGKHLTGPMLNLIYQSKGKKGMYLVSDGAPREEPFTEGEPMVVPNPLPHRMSIKTMAPLDYIVQQTYKLTNIPLTDVIRMVTLNPAIVMGVDNRKGKISEGYDADFVFLNDNLEVQAVIARGKICKKLEEK
jgi:N-acetylglucosamine-6-phosphate deacetylase